jgi:hypothetical protein
MSDDRDHTIATATVTSEETPYGVRINAGGHALRGDEPANRGGADTGPAPFGPLLSGLGACAAITLRMYAEHQSWPLAGVDVELTYVVKDRNTRWIDRADHPARRRRRPAREAGRDRGEDPGHQGGPGRNRDPYHHWDGLTGGDARDGAAQAGGVLIP